MVKLTTKIVKSTDLWSKINLCTKSLIYGKSTINYFQCIEEASEWNLLFFKYRVQTNRVQTNRAQMTTDQTTRDQTNRDQITRDLTT
jgi:hypothetical protein